MFSESEKRRILLMYITRVSGHRQATVAIQQALRQIDSNIEAPMINGFGYTYPVLEKVVNQIYMGVIKRTPKIWDYMYDNQKLVKNSGSIKDFLYKASHERISRLFKKYNPDTVVCTQAFPCGMVADYKQRNGLNTKLIGVLTDFAPHSFWINDGIDYYVVPSLDTKEVFIAKGISAEKIKVYGIPIRSKFSVALDRRQIASNLDLDSDIPTILIMGGGQGLGPIKKIVKSLLRLKTNVQLIVLAGTNKKIVERLRKYTQKTSKKVLIFEFTNNVDELMELATLIITKPGGVTTAESLTKRLPMVIVNPIPGQEMRNTDFLIEKGIGIRIDDPDNVGEEVEILLKSSGRMAKMKEAAYAHARPNATIDIAKLILNRFDDRSVPAMDEVMNLNNYV